MKVRSRIFIASSLILAAGIYGLVDWIVHDARLHYFITMEESLIDTSTLLAAQVSHASANGEIQVTPAWTESFLTASVQPIAADIYDFAKTDINLRIVVVDPESRIVFDSRNTLKKGAHYDWRDARLTLLGQYGARATYEIKGVPDSLHFYVAAPVKVGGKIIGSVSVGKPVSSIKNFVTQGRKRLIISGIVGFTAVILLLIPVSLWIIHPINSLIRYARAIRDGIEMKRPVLGHGGEMSELADAFEEMRDALEGKKYVEEYVQSLTHEMKSPLAAVQGAAELLQEEMPPEQRERFLSNIRTESVRLHQLVERMLSLSAIEKKKDLSESETVQLNTLIDNLSDSLHPMLLAKELTLNSRIPADAVLEGETFLLRQALANLIQNAIDFSPNGGTIEVTFNNADGVSTISIADDGPGLPDYALDKIFDRFYSLPRPANGGKSSGLGLNFVREIARLHNGSVSISNRSEGGAIAILKIANA